MFVLTTPTGHIGSQLLPIQHGASPAFVDSYLAMSRAMNEGLNHWADQPADPDAMTIQEFVGQEIVPAL